MPSATTNNIIDLMKTPNGYSIYEYDTIINNPATSNVVTNNANLIMSSINTTTNAAMQHSIVNPAKDVTVSSSLSLTTKHNNKIDKLEKLAALSSTNNTAKKFTLQQQNFTIYPYIYSKEQENHRFVIIPSRSQWFDLHLIHEIERKELPEWFKQKKSIMAAIVYFLSYKKNQSKFEKNEELYKKYRNYIIDLGKTQYVSPTMARKGLAGDACAIMRIHKFLEKWGLVNFVHKKPNNQEHLTQSEIINGFHSSHCEKSNAKRKEGFDKERSLLSKIYDKDDLELLKKITLKFRPLCNSCETLCGVSWHEYTEKLTRKYFHSSEIEPSTKVIESGESFEYHIKVCNSCYYDKNFPVVLSFDDFTKKSLLEQIKEIDFDSLYGKKKVQELNRLADVLEKNRFNLHKSSEEVKIEENELMRLYLQMPVQYLEKMSRVDVETDEDEGDDEGNDNIVSKQRIKGEKRILMSQLDAGTYANNNNNLTIQQQPKLTNINGEESPITTTEELQILQTYTRQLEKEEIKIYEEFLQAWLMKMYVKLEELEKWDKSVQWRLYENEAVKKYHLAEKIKLSLNKMSKVEEQQLMEG